MPDEVGLGGVQEHERASAQPRSLGDGHGNAPKGASGMHRLDLEVEGLGDLAPGRRRSAPSSLPSPAGVSGGDDGLGQDLSTEDHITLPADVLGHQTSLAHRFHLECIQQLRECKHVALHSRRAATECRRSEATAPARPRQTTGRLVELVPACWTVIVMAP